MKKTDEKIFQARKLVAKVGALMLRRNLTDLAGGNISMRIGKKVLMSPTLAGTYKFWNIKPEEVLVLDLEGNKLDGYGDISRESTTHLLLLNKFYPHGRAIIHSHARNILVFCSTHTPIPPVLESTIKFGTIKMVEYGDGGVQSKQLANNIYVGLKGQEDLIKEYAAAVLAPWHGIFAIGKDLNTVLDTIDRIEANAYCILMGRSLLSNQNQLGKLNIEMLDTVHASGGGKE